jgi:dTDP-4-dehydrorhamnose reductase
MRVVVTGKHGQMAQALVEAAASRGVELVRLGRPELDLTNPLSVRTAILGAGPDVVISAAAHTAVDKAESEPDLAFAINAAGAGEVARAAAELRVPIIHLSTDYVFDGAKPAPYVEEDAAGPISVYGSSKLEGERQVAAANPDHAIFRTAWIYSPYGRNFVKTMLALGETRNEVSVVGDQFGCPTSADDIADGLLAAARKLYQSRDANLRGVFHMVAAGEASWAEFAEEIFRVAERHGRNPVAVRKITTADYPTAARRPANSRLSTEKLDRVYGLRLPHWKSSLASTIERLLVQQQET